MNSQNHSLIVKILYSLILLITILLGHEIYMKTTFWHQLSPAPAAKPHFTDG